MHGFDRLGAIKSHETVVIQGSGPLGNFATAVARDHGARRCWSSARLPTV
jgi:threonine dehydrogenase-like Zn-dependent dehydrogenase